MGAWKKVGVGGEVNVSVAVVGTRKMAELHRRYLKKEGATDVLAFPQQELGSGEPGFVSSDEAALELGDIVLCYPLIVEEAAREEVFVDDVVEKLVLHGLRHLMGNQEDGD
jgi:probable rRNA maturation factor